MSQLLKPILSRWEINPPTIGAEEARGDLRPVFQSLLGQSILRPASPAGAYTCAECGERCRVTHLAGQSSGHLGYVHCQCGVSPVPDGALQRWEIDAQAMLVAAFRGIHLALREHVVGHLWQVGKANWAGRSREVWFARCYRRAAAAVAGEALRRRPKAILFAPTEAGAARWQEVAGNLTLALESTLTFDTGGIGFDVAYVEGRIGDAGLGATGPAVRRPKKRADRAANIESLRNEMIQHLRAARDHGFATKERTGEAELLPRPTQKALGERVGLTETDVSRCLKDSAARELKLYWETAQDLHQIMAWKGPVARGRKT